jgi:hypothetical protein
MGTPRHGWAGIPTRTGCAARRPTMSDAPRSSARLRSAVLRDWIKGQITAVEVGMLPSGQTVLDRIEQDNLLSLPAPSH